MFILNKKGGESMAKHGSLTYQLNNRMKALDRRGESRHQAKQEAKEAGISNKGGTVGIHSNNTYAGYWNHSKDFCRFLKANGIRTLEQVEKQHAIQYLTQAKERGLRPATLETKMAAINKVFRLDLHKKDAQLPPTRISDTIKGRNGQQGRFTPENWKDHITFAKATGVRRSSIHPTKQNIITNNGNWKVIPSSVWKRESDGRIMVSVVEKGGKYREIPVLREYEKPFLTVVSNRAGEGWQLTTRERWEESRFKEEYREARQGDEQPLFNSYTKEINNHAYRREYAEERYKEIIQDKGRDDRQDYRGYDREVCLELSLDLGHYRESVVVDSYLGQ